MGRRVVVKGARGVKAPIRRRLTVEEPPGGPGPGSGRRSTPTGARRWRCAGFWLERVFRCEDTEGEPLPDVPEVGYVTGDTSAAAWDALVALVERDGFRLTFEAEPGDTRGHTNYTDRAVKVDLRYDLPERIHIVVHELGHIGCDHEGRRDISRSQRETEAESVAFIVSTLLGLHMGAVATVYVGGWTDGDPDTITAAQAAIHTGGLLADLEDQHEHQDRDDRDEPASEDEPT